MRVRFGGAIYSTEKLWGAGAYYGLDGLSALDALLRRRCALEERLAAFPFSSRAPRWEALLTVLVRGDTFVPYPAALAGVPLFPSGGS